MRHDIVVNNMTPTSSLSLVLRVARAISLTLVAALPATPLAAAGLVDAIEFYNASLNHYFLTAVPQEADAIDEGAVGPGWIRTGFAFHAYAADVDAKEALPVCRFFGTPGLGPDAHFFTADATECGLVKANPRWLYEGIAFRALVPTAGSCPAGSAAVVRFYSPGLIVSASRHRYVRDVAEIARMRSAGWIEEGPVFCSPA